MAPRQDSTQGSAADHTRLRQACIDELPDNPHIKLSDEERAAIKAHMSVMAAHVLKKGAKLPDDATKLLILSVELYAVAKSLAQSETSSSTEFRADFERLEQELGDLMSVLTQFVDYEHGPKTSAILTEMTWNRFGNVKKLFEPEGVLNQLLADLSGGSVHLDAPSKAQGTVADSQGFLAGVEPLEGESVADSVRKMETALQTNLASIRAESRHSPVDQVEYLMEALLHRVNLFVLKHHEACAQIDADKANELLAVSTELSTLMDSTTHKALQLRSNPTQNRSAKTGIRYQIGLLNALANASHTSEHSLEPVPAPPPPVEESEVVDDIFSEEEIQALHKLTAKYLIHVAKGAAVIRGRRESIVASELRRSQSSLESDEVRTIEKEPESPKGEAGERWLSSIFSSTNDAPEESAQTESPKSQSSDSSSIGSWFGGLLSSSEQPEEPSHEDDSILGALARSAEEFADTVGDFGHKILDSITPEELTENIDKHYHEIVVDLLPEVEPEVARELVRQVSNEEEASEVLDPNIKIVLENFYQIVSKAPQDWTPEDIDYLQETKGYLSEMQSPSQELLECVDILSSAADRIYKAILKQKTASTPSSTATSGRDSTQVTMELLTTGEPPKPKKETLVERDSSASEVPSTHNHRQFLPKSLHFHLFRHRPHHTSADKQTEKSAKHPEAEEVPQRSSKFRPS
jgi:hypothetical protein